MPINPATGAAARTNTPSTWGSYEAAVARARRDKLAGVGYVLTDDDGLCGFDLDDCRDPKSGELTPLAAEVIALAETYIEVSPSGRGLRGFSLGKPDRARMSAGVEIYGKARYLTVTGQHFPGTPDAINSAPKTQALLMRSINGAAAHSEAGSRDNASSAKPPVPRAVADVCPTFVRLIKERATATEPEWFAIIQISLHTAGRDELAHKLSADHPNYTREETQAKLDRLRRLGIGPPTCGALECVHGSTSPCLNCRNRGQPGSSPIVFARMLAADRAGTILVEGGGIASAVDAALKALFVARAPVYRRGGALVRPIEEDVKGSKGRTTAAVRLKTWNVAGLVDLLARTTRFERNDARSKKRVSIDPPTRVAEAMIAREELWQFPRIIGCVTAPTLRPDGSLLSENGYDPATELYHVSDPSLAMPLIADEPTRADAQKALFLLVELLSDFPFVGAVDRAVALSALMTPVLRGGMATAPLHLVRAHTPGTGKSYLVDLASTIATGRMCPAVSVGKTEEELEKRLGAMLLGGSPIVSLDNANGEVGGDMLCHATERRSVSIRPLGVSETREVECRSTIFCNGNNTSVVGDMLRRTVICNFDAKVERPELRRFCFDPIARVLSDRGRYVAAVLSIVRAYKAAGSPKVCDPLGSYSDWTGAVRAPLLWLGEVDPIASMEEARAQDPVLTAIRELFGHWGAAPDLKTGAFYRANQISEVASQHADFHDLLVRQAGVGGKVSTKVLGRFLARIQGRIVGGQRLEMQADKKHGHTFALARAKPG